MVNGATARLNMTAPTFKEVKAIMGKPIEEPPEKQPLFETPDGVTQARQHLMKAANLYNLCVACVDKVIAPKVPPVAQTSEFFQAAVATLFINASHMRFIEKMPPHPLKQ
jgi:hypothetical protein